MADRTTLRVIVLDGLDWRWCNENRDVTSPLWRLAEDGCYARLEACAAPVTSDAVAALLAGRDLALHWVTDDRFTNSQDLIRTRPWMGEFPRHDLTLGLCNVPLTWPAFRMPKGSWLTSGYPVHLLPSQDPMHRAWHWPSSLDVLGYPIENIVADSNGGPGGSVDLTALAEYEVRICEWVLGRAPPADVEIVWLRSTDSAGHHVWGTEAYRESVRRICQCAESLSRADNVVVISDHGFDATSSPRCSEYMATNHGPTTLRAGLSGSHTMDGVLFAAGKDIVQRGVLVDQKLIEVAGGIFALLGIPPAPGMIDRIPEWALKTTAQDDDLVRQRMQSLGYVG